MKPVADTYAEQIALLNPEKPVRCYRNLHTGKFSVKQGTVRFHTNNIFLQNVKFLVNQKLRQRVLVERQKNVHAFVEGYVCSGIEFYQSCRDRWFDCSLVRYNPYECGHFMAMNVAMNHPCESAICCQLAKGNGKMTVYAKGLRFIEKPIDTQETACTMVETVLTHML